MYYWYAVPGIMFAVFLLKDLYAQETDCSIPLGMMMPPKKSKAARESGAVTNHGDIHTDKDDEESQEVNVFKVEILVAKRQRQLPPAECKFEEW